MCRGHITENTLVEVPPDYQTQQNADDTDTDQPWYSSAKVLIAGSLFTYDAVKIQLIYLHTVCQLISYH